MKTLALVCTSIVIGIAALATGGFYAARAILAPALERARTCGVEFASDHALSNKPYEAIVEAARRHGCDAIFMGSHGRKALSRLMHGSQTLNVLTHSDIPTLVLR